MSFDAHAALLVVYLCSLVALLCMAAAIVGQALLRALGLVMVSDRAPPTGLVPDTKRHTVVPASIGLRLFIWISLGLAAWNTVLVLLGFAGALRAPVVAVVSVALVGVAGLQVWRGRGDRAFSAERAGTLLLSRLDVKAWLELCAFGFLLIGLVLWCVRPPGLWDDSSYHLPYARYYLEQGGVVLNPWLRFPLFPHHPHLLFAVGLMTGGEVHAQILAGALPVALTSLGLFSLVRRVTGSLWAGVASWAFLASFEPLYEALGYAYVDHLLMLWVWAALVCLWLASESKAAVQAPSAVLPAGSALRWVVLCGVFAGTAASTKTFGGLLAFLIGLMVWALPGLRWSAAWRYALAVCATGLIWYVRSLVISGDPVHPLGGGLFGHYLWNAADLAAQHQEQAKHGVSRSLLWLPESLHKAGLPLLVPALMAPLLAVRRTPVAWGFALLLLTYTLIWHVATQVSRYIGPVLPMAAFLLACGVAWACGRLVSSAPIRPMVSALAAGPGRAGSRLQGLAAGLAAVAMAWVVSQQWAPMTTRLRVWDNELMSRPGVQVFREAALKAPEAGNVLLQLGYENATLFFPGRVVGDWFGPGRYAQMLRCTDVCRPVPALELVQVAQRHGARMVAVHAARFPANPDDYRVFFDVAFAGKDGFLLIAKNRPSTPSTSSTP